MVSERTRSQNASMWTKQVDAYNKEKRRFAIRQDVGCVCYTIVERPGSEIMKGAIPEGIASDLDEAKRWVQGEDVLLMPLQQGGPAIEC